MPLSTNGTVVARFAGALYNQQLSNATYSEVVTWSNTNSLASLMNEVYARDFSSVSDNTVAGIIVGNLGLSAIAGTQAYVAAQLTAAGANKGAVLASLLNGFSQMTADPVYGAAATAYNTQVASSQLLSQTAGNTGGTFVAPTTFVTYTLTTGFDNLVGTSFNDIFNAPTVSGLNRLNDGDRIDGGAGVDTVYIDYMSTGTAATPNFRNIESVVVRAQSATTDNAGVALIDGNNMQAARTVQIDAQRSLATDVTNKVTADLGVVNWESSNSRSDVVIEDVRIGNLQKTKDVTITFRESDPGNVDYGVYFDVHSLRNAGTGTTAINIFLMDTAAAAATPATPLLNQNFNTYTFYSNNVKVVLGGSGTAAGAAIDAATNYTELKAAFVLALKTASVGGVTTDLSASVTVTSSGPVNMTTEAAKATESNTVSANFLGLTGEVITLTSTGAATITSKDAAGVAGGWTAAGPAPSTGAIVQTFNTGSTSTTELVTSKVVLDDVGRGSTGGDLVIGGMSVGDTSTSRGVERFEIEVQDSSKLQTINSTNNALREVIITNGTTSNASSAYNTVVTNAGNLTVNGNVSVGQADVSLPGVDTNTTWGANINSTAAAPHSGNVGGVNAAGFTDVRVIDASAMTGKLAFTAAITTDTLGKYVNLVDTQGVATADVASAGNVNFNARGANFAYTGGANDDTMVVTMDAALAASNASASTAGQSDFTIVIDGGAGNDKITTNFAGNQAGNWVVDQARNNNITINGGEGNDTITTTGAGRVKINAGAGNDTVYTDNSGATKAAWTVNNAAGAVLTDLLTNGATLGASTANGFLFAGKLTVSYTGAQGLTGGAAAGSLIGTGTNGYEVTVDIPTGTNFSVNQFNINQAIKAAINNDPVLSKLLVAADGPSNVLTVTSLIDGVTAATGLSMTVSHTAMTATDTTAIAAFQAYTGNNVATFTNANTAMDALTGTVAVANAVLGMSPAGDGAGGVQITAGTDSTAISDNTINMGAGTTDVLVLGTLVGGSALLSSNDTIVFTGTGFNTTIVNFAGAGNGIDKLDLTSYLGDNTLVTGFNVLTATSVVASAAAAAATVVSTNQVFVMTAAGFNTTTATFAGLTGANFLSAINTGIAYGGIGNASLAPTATTVVGGVAHAVVLVENNLNLGQYDAFQLTWVGDGTAQTLFTAATLVGTIDVGTSLAALVVGQSLV